VAKQCRKVCEVARLRIPARATAERIAFWTTEGSMWCLLIRPVIGSVERSEAGKTYRAAKCYPYMPRRLAL
jgi:hypothetical protein